MRPGIATLALSIATTLSWSPVARAADKAQCLKAYESAQHQKNSGRLRASRSNLLVCVEPECPDLLRADCSAWLAEVERGMPTVVVVARSGAEEIGNARVLVDDELFAESLSGSALEVDPGRRVFRLEAPGREPVEQTVTIRQGEKNREVVFDFTPPGGGREERSAGPPVASYVLAGVGALALASFSYFGIKGLSGRSDLKDCKGSCAQEDVDSVHADFTRADISLAIGALALGGAAYFYFGADSDEGAPADAVTRPRLGVAPRVGGIETAIQIAF